MNGCTRTSAASWKQSENALRMPWICGGRALTMNGPTKRWGCAARAKSTSLQRENTKAHRKIWIILKMCSRRVSPKGLISLEGQPLFLSTSLGGWSVGLKPIAEDVMEVWFGPLLLGQVDLATRNFIRVDIRPNKTAKEQEKV